ncbi:MAG: NAD(P)-binding protein [Bacteroidota bacterium]
MEINRLYDCAIIGGGLGGLCLAIQLADKKYSVIVFEKSEYPFHKVCGEYISMESHDFLASLGLPLHEMGLPRISNLGVSSQQGFMLNSPLKMGGFGISRYRLDHELCKIALSKNVHVVQNCKVSAVNDGLITTNSGSYSATITCGAYGKYTPAFIQQARNYSGEKHRTPQYLGVKYHVKANLAADRIELHNFRQGYCGISKVEDDWYCLCYLTHADNLLKHKGSIKTMEEQVLYKNPFLKTYFTCSEFRNPEPLVISNIRFNKKQTSAAGVFLLGDAAGSITPLCGNGMSMAMRASKLLAAQVNDHLRGQKNVDDLKRDYEAAWNKAFAGRIKTGYYLQHLFGRNLATQLSLKALARLPVLTQKIISLTHGEVF